MKDALLLACHAVALQPVGVAVTLTVDDEAAPPAAMDDGETEYVQSAAPVAALTATAVPAAAAPAIPAIAVVDSPPPAAPPPPPAPPLPLDAPPELVALAACAAVAKFVCVIVAVAA